MRCKGQTVRGKRCKRTVPDGQDFCTFHDGSEYSKATDAEVKLRVATVVEMSIKGQSRQDIIRYGQKEWNIAEDTVDRYIAKAKKKISESVDDDIETQTQLAIARFNDLYKRNYTIQDYRECRQVQSDIVKLLGLGAPSKLDLTSSDGSMTPQSLDDFYSKLNNDSDSE